MTSGNGTEDDAMDVRDVAGDEIARLLQAAGARPAVPAERAERVRDAVRAHWRRAARSRRTARRTAWAAAALTAAAVWALFLAPDWSRWLPVTFPPTARAATLERTQGPVRWVDRAEPAVGAGLPSGTILETGVDGRVAVRLETGASVRIDAGTRLRFTSGEEVILDRGAVYLDTGNTPRPGTAVAVRTALGMVRDTGTQFQVAVHDGGVRMSVREGAVRFERRGAFHDAPSGVELTVRDDGAVTTRNIPPSGPEWDWILGIAPPFALEGRRLDEYLDWVVRETGLRVEYGDPAIASDAPGILLHGSIEGLRPDESLAAVLPTCGLSHSIAAGAIRIDRPTPRGEP